ncbi:MAG TPA: phosphatase PAP2 family protein, partial [Gammaproteobacteria bacterium]|nr:phosphatase PAP2 family protein [Gammaproteobacteria bacterium]
PWAAPTMMLRCRPDLRRRLAARFDTGADNGAGSAVPLFLAAAALLTFLGILFAVVAASGVVAADHRLVDFLATQRTPGLDQAMFVFTYIGSGRVVSIIAGTCALAALLLGRRRDAALLVLLPATAAAFFEAVKWLVARPRPSLAEARILAAGFSFPSGHATMAAALWGTFALLAALALRRTWTRILIALAAAALALLIGFSRVYLGVHYPTDVLAGWAGGTFWVALAFAIMRIRRMDAPGAAPRPHWMRATAAALLAVGAAVYVGMSLPRIPAPPAVPAARQTASGYAERGDPSSALARTRRAAAPVAVLI